MKMMMTRDVSLVMMSLVGLVVASNSIVLEVSAILPASVTNFQGHFTCPNVMLGKPKTEEQVSLIVKEHPLVKASGVGHSWNTEFTCSGNASNAVNIVTTEMQVLGIGCPDTNGDGIGDPCDTTLNPACECSTCNNESCQVDEANRVVKVAAGVRVRDLLDYLATYGESGGYTLPAFPWFIDQTVAGAVSTATHGTTMRHGSMSQQVTEFEVVLADGSTKTFSDENNEQLMSAMRVNVGRLGVNTWLTMKIEPQRSVRRSTRRNQPIQDFVGEMKTLQEKYIANRDMEGADHDGDFFTEMFGKDDAGLPIHEKAMYWFVPTQEAWHIQFSLLEVEPMSVTENQQSDGRGALTPGERRFMRSNARLWSEFYAGSVTYNVMPGTFASRRAYMSMTEGQSRRHRFFSAYDQWEMFVPLSKVGDCVAAVADRLYNSDDEAWRGFRTQFLMRLTNKESGYLSYSSDEPVMGFNMEDYVQYNNDGKNDAFQAVMDVFRSPVCGPARVHWGKAGWDQSRGQEVCFDGAAEFPNTWCDFGCAVSELDPNGKFAGISTKWQWAASSKSSSDVVVEFAQCCGPDGFKKDMCTCESVLPAEC